MGFRSMNIVDIYLNNTMVHFAIFKRDSRIERLDLYFLRMMILKALNVHSS